MPAGLEPILIKKTLDLERIRDHDQMMKKFIYLGLLTVLGCLITAQPSSAQHAKHRKENTGKANGTGDGTKSQEAKARKKKKEEARRQKLQDQHHPLSPSRNRLSQ